MEAVSLLALLSLGNERKPPESGGKGTQFLPPKLGFDTKEVACSWFWVQREAGGALLGWLEMWGHDTGHGGERRPTEPHLGTDLLGLLWGLANPP